VQRNHYCWDAAAACCCGLLLGSITPPGGKDVHTLWPCCLLAQLGWRQVNSTLALLHLLEGSMWTAPVTSMIRTCSQTEKPVCQLSWGQCLMRSDQCAAFMRQLARLSARLR